MSLSLLLFIPLPANSAQCDNSGFDKPCQVVGGVYRAAIPEGEGPFPVMIYLYGSGGHSVTVSGHPFFLDSVVGRGYALIVPAALDVTYVGGWRNTGWSLRNERTHPRDEVAFLSNVIADVGRRFPIDRSQILIAGQSRGGFLIWELACHNPDLATAYAVHAAGYLGTMPSRCSEPVRFLQTHGIADPIVPFTGRPGFGGQASMTGIQKTLDKLAETNDCDELDPDDVSSFHGLQRHSWTGCASGSSLDLMLHGGGHSYPGQWFRAVLDWFEETPEGRPAVVPITRAIGAARPSTTAKRSFKSPPAPGQPALSRD